MEKTSPSGRVRGKRPSESQLPIIELPSQSAQLVKMAPERPRDTPPDPLAEQKKKEEARRIELAKQISPIVNDKKLVQQNEAPNIYERLGLQETCSLEEAQTAYDILSATLKFPEDVTILNTHGATEDQRVVFFKLQKLQTRFKTAFEEVKRKIQDRVAKRTEADRIYDLFSKQKEEQQKSGKNLLQLLGLDESEINALPAKVALQRITSAYTQFTRELYAQSGYFDSLATKLSRQLSNAVLTNEEKLDLVEYKKLKEILEYYKNQFDPLQKKYRDKDLSGSYTESANRVKQLVLKLISIENKPGEETLQSILNSIDSAFQSGFGEEKVFQSGRDVIANLLQEIHKVPRTISIDQARLRLNSIENASIRAAARAVLVKTFESPQRSEQKATPPKDEASKLKGFESAFNDFMQEIIAKPQGKNVNTIIIELRALIAHNPTHFHLYADDLEQIENMWKQIQYTPEKWTQERIDTWLPNIKYLTIREAMRAVFSGTVEQSKANEGEAIKNFENVFIARSRLGYDQLLVFLDDHANSPKPDKVHTKLTMDAARRISSVMKSMSKEMLDLGFLQFHPKYSDSNIITILSNELKYLEQNFDRGENIRNICSDLLEQKAKALRARKVSEFITSKLQSTLFDDLIPDLYDHVTKDESIRAVWSALKAGKNEFLKESTKESFLSMSQADITSGKLADYDDAAIFWDHIKDQSLRTQTVQCFKEWARTKQREWLGDVENERTELAELLSRQVRNVIPLYIEATILESNSIQSVFSADQQSRLQAVIHGKLKSSLDNGMGFIDASIRNLSPSAVHKSLTFVKTESRFNAVSAQTIIQNKLKFEFADDEQLGKKSIGRIDQSDKLAPLLHSALNRIGRSLYTELATIKKATTLAVDTHGRILQHPTIFVDSDYGAYSPGSGEKDDAFEIRRKAALRDNIISLLLTRLIAKKDPPLDNPKIRSRVETMTRLGLDQAIYFNVVSADKALEFIEVRQEAESYLIELGFTQEELDAIDKNLMIPAEKQSLLKAVNKYLLNEGGKDRKVELLDPDLVVERPIPRDNLALGVEVIRGGFDEYNVVNPILGKDSLWSKPVWNTDTRLSSEDRVKRIDNFLKKGTIEYSLTGTIDSAKRVKSGLGKRVEKGSFYLEIPIEGALSDTDATLIRAMARDTSYAQRDILKKIQEKLQKSEKMRALVKEYNDFIETQVLEAAQDPDAFLKKIGMTPNNEVPLTPEGWLNIFFYIGVGRFSSVENVLRSPNAAKLYGFKLSNRESELS